MKQHAFAHLHPDRFALAQHLAVDGKQLVTDLVALRTVELLIPLFSELFELRDRGPDENVHRHVAAAAERGLKFFEHEKHFPIISACVAGGLNIQRACLARVHAAAEIVPGHYVSMVEAEAGRLWHERNSARTMRRDEGGALF